MKIPDPIEELDRKVVEELERLEVKRMKDDISPDQYNRAIMTMWNVTAGLIPKETMGLLDLAPKDTDLLEVKAKSVFVHPHKTQIVNVTRKGQSVDREVVVFKGDKWIGVNRNYQFDTGIEAAEKYNAIIQSVVKQGFEEL